MNSKLQVRLPQRLVLTMLTLGLPAAPAAPVHFYRVGDLPGGIFRSEIRDALQTRAGIVAAGNATQNDGSVSGDTAIRWTPAGGIQILTPIVVNPTPLLRSIVTASAINSTGRVIVGRSRSYPTGEERLAVIFRSDGAAPRVLGKIPGGAEFSAATAVSADGTTVYGWGQNAANKYAQAFRWTADEGLSPLGFVSAGDLDSSPTPRGTSADGTVMVGTSISDPATGLGRGYLYRHRAGMSALPLLPGGTWNGTFGLTPSGRTIIGYGNSAARPLGEIVQWNRRGRAKSLGTPSTVAGVSPNNGFGGISRNGKVVVFTFDTVYVHNQRGWFDLEEILLSANIDLHDWITLGATGMSSDGTLIFGAGGTARGTEGWVAEFPRGYLASLGAKKGERSDDCDADDDDD